jgi:carbonic anhydrase
MLHQKVDQDLSDRKNWTLRRQLRIPNNKRLWVLACMDERLPVEKALGIGEGDAHIFRNAGWVVISKRLK